MSKEGASEYVNVAAHNHHGARSKAVLAKGYGVAVSEVLGPYYKSELVKKLESVSKE